MNLRQLRTFEKISTVLSFSKAAEELGYSQSAVTIQIQQLEQEFETRLFDRIGGKVSLTTEGLRFRPYVRSILKEIEILHTNFGSEEDLGQSVHIGSIDSLSRWHITQIVKEIFKENPSFSVKVTTASPKRLIEMMEHNDVDLIYILDELTYGKNWKKPLEKEERIVFVAPPDTPLKSKKNLRLRDLAKESFILTEQRDNYRFALDQALAEKQLSIPILLEIPNTDIICNYVMEGYGLSFLPEFAVKEYVDKGQLITLNVKDFSITMHRQLIYHQNKWMTSGMKVFLETVEGMDL